MGCKIKDAEEALIKASVEPCRPWLKGSGGHKMFGHCDKLSTWTDADPDEDPEGSDEYYCDEHVPGHNTPGFTYYETPWAMEARIYEEVKASEICSEDKYDDLSWHVEAAIERLLDIPPKDRTEGSLVWSALYWLHEGLAGKPKGLVGQNSLCHICGAKSGEPHKGIK